MGVAEVFGAIVSEQMAHRWWEPVTRAGYQAEPVPEEYWQQLRSLGVSPNEGEPLSRIVRRDGSEFRVDISKGEEDGRVYWKLYLTGGNTLEECDDLIRIFLASGAGPWGGRPGCRRLYRCPQGMAPRFLENLTRSDPSLRLTPLEGHEAASREAGPGRFPQGVIGRDDLAIRYFTGPAADPATGAEAEFVALDYKAPWLLGRGRLKEFVAEIADGLVQQGASEVALG